MKGKGLVAVCYLFRGKRVKTVAWMGGICRMDGGKVTKKALYYIAFSRSKIPNTLYQREVGRFPCGRAYPSDKENDRLNLTGGSRYTQRNG